MHPTVLAAPKSDLCLPRYNTFQELQERENVAVMWELSDMAVRYMQLPISGAKVRSKVNSIIAHFTAAVDAHV